MAVQIITIEDLNEFRSLLLNDIKEIIQSKPQQTKQWLKSKEVRKLLNISPGTNFDQAVALLVMSMPL